MRFAPGRVLMRTFSLGCWIACAAILLPAGAHAAERPTWQALPDETIAVVRLPNLKEAYEAFRTRTKLGAVAFDDDRIEALKALILEGSKTDVEELTADLVKFGLSIDDLIGTFGSEFGYAATLAQLEKKPAYVGLFWSECGEEMADKWIAALDKVLESQVDGPEKVSREDLELAGVKVRRLRIPIVGPDGQTAHFKLGINSKKGVLVDPGIKEADPAAPEKLQANFTALIARSGGKLLIGHTLETHVKSDKNADDERAGDEAESALREHATAVFARFLEAQSAHGEGIVQKRMQTPGLTEALPDGVPIVDVLIDIPAALKFVDDGPDAAEQMKVVRALALDQLGPLAYRMTLDGNAMRSGIFLSAPSPRNAVVKLIDQPALPPKPADWVSTDVVGYQHWSFDLGTAYKLIADIVRHQTPKGEESVKAIEEQTKQFLQTDPVTLLSSLGTKHTIITFLPEKKEAGAPAENETSQNAMAFVWRLTDEALWKRLLQMAALVSVKDVAEERGFSGLRHDQDGFHGGWFIGDGTMVLAIGKGVTEKTLSMLRTPPKAEASLAGSPIATRAAELIPPQDAITYDLTNGPTLLKFFNQTIAAAMETSQDSTTKKLKPIWPSDKELDGAIGVSVSVTTIDEKGLTHRSVSDLPPP